MGSTIDRAAVEGPTGAGDEAWGALYGEHRRPLLGFLRRRVRRPEEAEDLVQETFARAIGAAELPADPPRLRSYLFTIAHHLVIDAARRRRPVLFSEADDAVSIEPVDPEDGPEATVRARRLDERLAVALAQLPERYRLAYRLAVEECLAYAEVAERTGWSLAQVKINVYRARRRLWAALASELGHPTEEAP